MKKCISKILLIILLVTLISIISYKPIRNVYFENYLKKEMGMKNFDDYTNYIVSMSMNGTLYEKYYEFENKQLVEHYLAKKWKKGQLIENINIIDYTTNTYDIYTYLYDENNELVNIEKEKNIKTKELQRYSWANLGINKEILNVLNDSNEKFEYVKKIKIEKNVAIEDSKDKEYHVIKFTNRHNNNVKIYYINTENKLVEKYVMFVTEDIQNAFSVYEYKYEFNKTVNINELIPDMD